MRIVQRRTPYLPGILAGLITLLGLCGLGDSAWATTAMIVESPGASALPPAEQASLRTALEKAVQGLPLDLIPAKDVEVMISGEPQLKGCYSELCFERLGRLLDSQVVFHYQVTALAPTANGPGGFQLSVELFDGEVGAIGARLREDCPSCTSTQAATQLAGMVKRVTEQSTARPRGTLEISSQPPGAAVFVDGTELGITPYKRRAFAGSHKLVLGHVGYRSEQIEVEVSAAGSPPTTVTLVAGSGPASAAAPEKTPVYKKWWLWVAIGGAAVAAAAITAGVVVGTRGTERMIPANTLMVNF